MGTQQFCLRWNNHQTNMLNVFDQLLQSGDFVDVTLACEGVSIKAHKMVLSACSPYFQNLFKDNPCQHPIVILKDMRYTELRSIVDFMYKGEINVSQDQLTTLLKTAETLKVKGLAEVSSGSVPNSQGETLNANPEDQSTIPAQAIGSPPQQTPPPPQQQSLPPDGRTSPPSKRKRHRPARRPSNGDNGEASTNDMPRDVEPLPLPKSEPVDLIAEPPVELLMSADGHYQMDQSGVEHDRSHESGDRESGLAPSAVGLIAGGSPQPSTSRAQSSTQVCRAAHVSQDRPGHSNDEGTLRSSDDGGPGSGGGVRGGLWTRDVIHKRGGSSFVPWVRMPCRSGPCKTWQEETMFSAVRAVLKLGMPLINVSRRFGIPYPTLFYYTNRVRQLLKPYEREGTADNCALKGGEPPVRKKLKTDSIEESGTQICHEDTFIYNQNSTERQVEIHPNSGVRCSESVWTAAQSCPSATCFTRLLLVNMFDIDTLVSSNLRGGTSKRPNASKTERKALDPVRIDAIMEAAITKYGAQITKSRLGMTINNKITELRNKFKGRSNARI